MPLLLPRHLAVQLQPPQQGGQCRCRMSILPSFNLAVGHTHHTCMHASSYDAMRYLCIPCHSGYAHVHATRLWRCGSWMCLAVDDESAVGNDRDGGHDNGNSQSKYPWKHPQSSSTEDPNYTNTVNIASNHNINQISWSSHESHTGHTCTTIHILIIYLV